MPFAITPHSDLEPLAEGVDHRDAHAVQPAGHLVAGVAAELSAGVQHGQHRLQGAAAGLRVHLAGDAPPVVLDRQASIWVDNNQYFITVPRKCLIN